jgi:hypothetical protein
MRFRRPRALLSGPGDDEPEPEFNFAQRVWFRVWLARKKIGWLFEKITKKNKREGLKRR